ncbi:MAG: methyltransferase domain-containing protein [Anaerolineales bacterium]
MIYTEFEDNSKNIHQMGGLKMGKNNYSDCCNYVNPVNGARPFKTPAEIITKPYVLNLLKEKPKANFLEIGAGALRNTLFLQEKGFSVDVFEVKGIEKRFPEQYKLFMGRSNGNVYYKFPVDRTYDFILCTFVIETICNPEQRTYLLVSSLKVLKPKGILLISVRGPKDLVTGTKSGIPCSDGFLTPGYSFSRSYTPKQLRELLASCEYNHVKLLHKESTKEPEYLHALASKSGIL